MNVAELIRHVRESYLRDAEAPFLFPAPELLRYLNEAQALFARHTHVLMDDESAFTELTTVAGESKYALDPSIIFVSELYDSIGRRLKATSRANTPRTEYRGRPRFYTLDAKVSTVRFVPTPDAEYVFRMVVARKPLGMLKSEYDIPEVPEEYHLALLDWVAYKALRNNDTEASNVTAAENFRLDWAKRLAEAKRDAFAVRHGSNVRAANNWTGR